MEKTVIKEIDNQIQSRKYSAPDITEIDQLTVVIRYIIMADGLSVELFIGFLPSVGHKGEEINQIIKYNQN